MVDKQEVQRQTAGLLQKDTEGQNRERERQNHTGRYPLRDWRPLNITGQTEDFTLLLVGEIARQLQTQVCCLTEIRAAEKQ